jgi:hypothetical protein
MFSPIAPKALILRVGTLMAVGMQHGIAALMTCSYALGAPDVAPLFPRDMEVALVRYHKEMNVIGKSVHEKYAIVAQNVGLAQAQQSIASFKQRD